MAMTIDEKRQQQAKLFISGAKEAFKMFIPRDTINEIAVTECVEKDGAFELSGPVDTTSPTGKLKTFGYTATVIVDADGNASLSKLHVREF